ncbi:tRNA uridine-5-carboxymethylaminomethyl(34) synthesis GTPase MnmE [Parablautia muri]|uniref:tRNA modification GTPase MnmE n=1 Tax=Parablautia muri TaxID=2320879 RepID=A0A9X5GPU8_9FIRM|nr:tRNA uridine-5-carboxymethylaminomethyl(34) synthesis GTPase MnmE [Parablautia muri]NBJ91028.1 tRNA uridine-5-carboxymethylaminomethyl(34) synthesis GTPase MnmE [Parablautia muri]
MKTDTIAAIATAMGNAGIGIIRVSGEESIEIVDLIYRNNKNERKLKNFKSHTIHYGFIYDGNEVVDEVMVSIMKKPNSFTAEDTVEINCHGGVVVLNRILDMIVKNGARLAEPGEFTKRAFLNGRIDLSRAEAVMDIISSKNEMALKNSMKHLGGSIYEKIKDLREDIIYEIAFIESALDDPEHISLDGYADKLYIKNENLINEVNKLLLSAENGKIIKEGIKTVIVGKPNAGKSSLLNVLVGEEKAIVTDIAGTTRDILEENINIGGISLKMIDTAGIRFTEDIIEKIGVEKAKKYVEDADLIVYVVDSSVPLDENDFEIMKMIENRKSIILFNKSDLDASISFEDLMDKIRNSIIIKTSTKENTGIDNFEAAIKKLFFKGEIFLDDEVMITNLRHKEALGDTLFSLNQVKKSIENKMPEDFFSIDLISAYASLGKIIGEEIEEDLVNEIFSKFCMGK